MRIGLSATEVQRILHRGMDDKARSRIVAGLSFFERLELRHRGSVKIGEYRLDGWSCALPVYLFRCDVHGYQGSYANGHDMLLICPVCNRERRGIPDQRLDVDLIVEGPPIV